MSSFDFIPRKDTLFDGWQNNFVIKGNLYRPTWAWTPEIDDEWVLLTETALTKKLLWDSAWAKIASNEYEHNDDVLKNEARKSYESGDKLNPSDTSLRLFIARYIRFSPKVTIQQKADLGLTLPDDIKTPAPGMGSEIVNTEVIGDIKSMARLMHRSQITTPGIQSKALGEGVDAIEVHIAYTDALAKEPPPPIEFKLDGEVKRGIYVRQFTEDQEGMRCWYKARKRFKGKTKTYGPFCKAWSSVIS